LMEKLRPLTLSVNIERYVALLPFCCCCLCGLCMYVWVDSFQLFICLSAYLMRFICSYRFLAMFIFIFSV
jgi:hypothetical protein